MYIRKDDILFDRYRIEGLLGEGAFGKVYLVRHLRLNVSRALKCINKCHAHYLMAVHEADILKNLRHPAIPIIYDIEEDDDCVCIIEEYIEGMSLNSFLSIHKKLSVREIIRFGTEICDVVQYLHDKGISHHDIKPENIIYDGTRLRLLDYGNAEIIGSKQDIRMGTKWYAAPEIYRDNTVEGVSDIYAIGVLILVLATGRKDLSGLMKVHPQSLRKVVAGCIAHEKGQRFGSAFELKRKLEMVNRHYSVHDDVSLHIGFIGAYPHCGVTHCSMLSAVRLRNTGHSVVICERNESRDFFALIKAGRRIYFNRGVFNVDGINMVPLYHGCVSLEPERNFDTVIYDYGCDMKALENDLPGLNHVCVVSGGKPYEAEVLMRRIEELKVLCHTTSPVMHTLVNYASGKQFKSFLEQYKVINPVRVPYLPDL